jgi:hypothetical protein
MEADKLRRIAEEMWEEARKGTSDQSAAGKSPPGYMLTLRRGWRVLRLGSRRASGRRRRLAPWC